MTRAAVLLLLCATCTTSITPRMCSEAEACDGEDDDCDPSTIEGTDADGDGYCSEDGESLPCCASGGGDCDDANDAIHPGATEVAGNAADEDCSGSAGGDQDGDGHNEPGDVSGGLPDDDCCDEDAAAFPGQTAWFTGDDGETACGGWDYDCSGQTEVEVGTPASCECTPSCTGTDGWEGLPPACGDAGTYLTCGGGACGACPATTEPRQQGCH